MKKYNADNLPAQLASMKDVEAIYGIPVEAQKYIREHHKPKPGEPPIFTANSRVRVLPLIRAFGPLFSKIFVAGSAKVGGLEGFEDMDLDYQRALSTREDVIQKKRDNAIANAQLLTQEGVEREIAEPLMAVATGWKNYEKITGGKLKSLLVGAGVAPEIVLQAIATAVAGIQEPLTKLREQLKLDETEQ